MALVQPSSLPVEPVAHELGGTSHVVDTLADVNAKISDATLLDGAASVARANHTGTQIASTISDFGAAAGALERETVSLTFAADAGNTIEERVGFPFALSEVEDIHVGPIGVKGTGTITFAKGMQGGTNILTAASYDVFTATDNTMVSVGALSATPANYQGGVLDVVLISIINCSVPHLVKITFKRQ